MDPISSLLVGHAAGKLLDKFGSNFDRHYAGETRVHVLELTQRGERQCSAVTKMKG